MAVTNRHTLWFHAVSVGEVNICTQLIKALEPRLPNMKLVVSTTTTTGMAELEKKLPSHILKVYYPIDFPWAVERALKVVHPEAIVLVEAEIWPNFLWGAYKRGKPVFLINARLSNRSYRGYRLLGFLFRRLFSGLAGVGCQNETDAAKLRRLGCEADAVRVVGNLKYDAATLDEKPLFEVPKLFEKLGVPPGSLVLVGGSTHAGEEGLLAEVYQRLREKYPNLFLVLVPRHFERAGQAGADVLKRGLKVVYRKDITEQTRHGEGTVDCLIVNTTGELRYFYEYADAVFVGKSLTSEGGQNPLEPAAMAKPVVFGPNMQNFTAIAEALKQNGGAIQVANQDELQAALERLLADPELRKQTGRKALAVVHENLGAIRRTCDMILESLRERDVYVAEE
jgi:3-deoxy-D-manno-octulosonic-acid transferase